MIEEIVLFVSQFSRNCKPCIKLFETIPDIKKTLMKLDTLELRNIVQNNKLLKIRVVPTLLIVYKDGNIQLFEGKDKINFWMSSFISDSRSKLEDEDDDETVIEDNEVEETKIEDIEEELPQQPQMIKGKLSLSEEIKKQESERKSFDEKLYGLKNENNYRNS